MAICRIVEDSSNYDSVVISETEVSYEDLAQFDGRSLAATWRPLPVRIYSMNRQPDIFRFAAATPAIQKKAWEVLAPLVRGVAEALPLQNKSNLLKIYAFNVVAVVDCLDHEQAVVRRFPEGNAMYPLEKYAFAESIAEKYPVFRLPETCYSEIFATDSFRKSVLEAQLKGLVFKQLA